MVRSSARVWLITPLALVAMLVGPLPAPTPASSSAVVRPTIPTRSNPNVIPIGVWTQLVSPVGLTGSIRMAQLDDGRVLVIGSGGNPVMGIVTVQPEVYDPATDTWTATPPIDLCCNEILSPPVTLADGRVLAGGYLFNPVSWTWSPETSPRYSSALLLRDGRVVEWPGDDSIGTCSEDPVIYDPTTDSAQAVNPGGWCIGGPDMVQLPDGEVLVHGGCHAVANYLLLDAVTRVVGYATTSGGASAGQCSGETLLPDGELGAFGWLGVGGVPYVMSPQVARFSPLDLATTALAPLPIAMTTERAILNVGDKVVMVAGAPENCCDTESLIYDPTTNHWSNLAHWPGSSVEDSLVLHDGTLLAADFLHFYRMTPPGLAPALPAATYVPLAPVRLLDTRTDNGLNGPFVSGLARTFQVSGRGGVPANAVAITGNLTVTGQTSAGHVSLGPLATNAPTSSTLNFPLGDNRANGVTVALGAGGRLSATFLGTKGAKTSLVLDVTGYFLPDGSGATYLPVPPARILDTRSGSGPVHTGVALTFPVATKGGVPANATAVTGNLTISRETSRGYVSLGPLATDAPTSSTLNVPLGDTRGNGVTVELGAGGTISATFIGAKGSTAQLTFDVTGYFVPDGSGARYYSVAPVRLLDSRIAYNQAGQFSNATAAPFQIVGPMVPIDAVAVTGNLTVTAQTSAGSVALGPMATDAPGTSTISFPIGDNRANNTDIGLGANGILSATFVGTHGAKTQLIFDLTGYFAP